MVIRQYFFELKKLSFHKIFTTHIVKNAEYSEVGTYQYAVLHIPMVIVNFPFSHIVAHTHSCQSADLLMDESD